jgi:hypothetical protein
VTVPGPDPRTLANGALVVLDVHGVVFTNPFPAFIREIGERVGIGGDELFPTVARPLATAVLGGFDPTPMSWFCPAADTCEQVAIDPLLSPP